nr:NADH dehydrogenase subunit 6 [Octodonta nipae]
MKIIILTMILPLLFISSNHPINFMIIILIQTTLVALISTLITKISWFSYILFLIMVGGMLILFMYMTNVASNEKFPKYSKPFLIFSSTLIIMLLTFINLDKFWSYMETELNSSLIYFISLSKFYNQSSFSLILLTMIYLLITLIMTVKLTNKKSGPLRHN